MTKQQKTYLLLTATLIVWGIIGYQIYNRLNPKQEQVATTIMTKKYTPQKLIEVANYTIHADYRDPFLGRLSGTKKALPKKKKKKKTNKKKKRFPKISYNGVIEGASKSYIITVNGNQETFDINQTINEVTLIKANDNEITIRFNEETKIIKQQ